MYYIVSTRVLIINECSELLTVKILINLDYMVSTRSTLLCLFAVVSFATATIDLPLWAQLALMLSSLRSLLYPNISHLIKVILFVFYPLSPANMKTDMKICDLLSKKLTALHFLELHF